jgi:hypothetical protein
MPDLGESLRFLPYLRRGLAAGAARAPGESHLHKTVGVQVVDEHGRDLVPAAVTQRVPLAGPGDVIGLDPSEIGRVVPAPGEPAFDDNLLPFIEFKEPDLPWRYSIDTPAAGRLLPWLALLAIPQSDPRRPIAVERIRVQGRDVQKVSAPVDLLPLLDELWAWAHVQLAPGANVRALDADPSATCARLLCPVRLRPRTAYLATLVPAYEAGRRAALGLRVETDHLRLWSAADAVGGVLKLPVYHSWSWTTGEGGDFEELLDRVMRRMARKPAPRPGALGFREVDGRAPAIFGDAWRPDDDRFHVEGALIPLEGDPPAPSKAEPAFGEFLRDELLSRFDDSRGDPLVRLPLYGEDFIGDPAAELAAGLDAGWFAELNLVRKHRVAASLGAKAVRGDQERLVAECWRQAGEARRADELVHRATIGALLGTRLEDKHLRPLSAERALLFSAPLHDRAPRSGASYRALLDQTGAADLLAHATRRVFARRVGFGASGAHNGRTRADLAAFVGARVEPRPPRVANSQRQRVLRSPLRPDAIAVQPVAIDAIARDGFAPARDVLRRLSARITDGGQPLAALAVRRVRPELRLPAYEYLAAIGPDALVRNLDAMEPDSVLLLREHPAFIHAFLAGLNHELVRELRWRGYRLDGAPTVFRHFWESLAPDPSSAADIAAIATWGRSCLAAPALRGDGGTSGRIVLALKSDLVRRYPDFLLHLLRVPRGASFAAVERAIVELNQGAHGASPDVFEPVFRAIVGATSLFGFDRTRDQLRDRAHAYYFVLSQPHALPTFGLDAPTGTAGPGTVEIGELSWDHVELAAGSWVCARRLKAGQVSRPWSADNTSARIALCLFQAPFQAVISADDFLALEDP